MPDPMPTGFPWLSSAPHGGKVERGDFRSLCRHHWMSRDSPRTPAVVAPEDPCSVRQHWPQGTEPHKDGRTIPLRAGARLADGKGLSLPTGLAQKAGREALPYGTDMRQFLFPGKPHNRVTRTRRLWRVVRTGPSTQWRHSARAPEPHQHTSECQRTGGDGESDPPQLQQRRQGGHVGP